MTTLAPSQNVLDAGVYGLRYGAERQSLNLHSFDVEAIVRAVLAHALANHYVTRDEMMRQVEDEKAKGQRHLNRACAAENARSNYLCRVHKVVTDLAETNPELAQQLAEPLGVWLPQVGS